MKVLVTNDDGLHAPGLTHLAAAAAAAGHEVTAVAPGATSRAAEQRLVTWVRSHASAAVK